MSWFRSKTPKPAAPTDRLLETARGVAADRGWPWLEPVEVDIESRSADGVVWLVRTNCLKRGMNIRVSIREPDFVVVSAHFMPR